MLLKEKFQKEQIYINAYTFKLTKESAEHLVEMAEDFAVEFYNWMRVNDMKEEYFHYTDKDMLNVFKEEI
jgi:hypothetical protein